MMRRQFYLPPLFLIIVLQPTYGEDSDEWFSQEYLAEYKDDLCDELWFSRNAMLNQAGYCFQTTLGQAIFDNSDCTTRTPQISDQATQEIAKFQTLETKLGCEINTDKSKISVSDIEQRLLLTVQPGAVFPSETEHSCLGYNGPSLSAYSAPDQSSHVLYNTQTGDDLDFEFGGGHEWTLTRTRSADGKGIHMGWVYFPPELSLGPTDTGGVCSDIAG